MIDTHCHLNLEPLSDDPEKYMELANKVGVDHFIVPGVNVDSSKQSVALAQTHPNVFAAIGIHPEEAKGIADHDLPYLITQLEELMSDKVVAIGECGLDLFRVEANERAQVLSQQLGLLQAQIGLAQSHNLPISFHVRDAQAEMLSLLEINEVRGILHCFSGDKDYLEKALDLGLYISFAGNVTFANAQQLRDMLAYVPLDRLLLETDSPFLNPDRGQFPNHPAQVAKVYERVAAEKNISIEELDSQVWHNAVELFKLNKI